MADLPDDPADRIDEVVRRLAAIQFGDEARGVPYFAPTSSGGRSRLG